MRVFRRLAAACFAAGVLALVPGLPAYAHDGPVTLDVAGDGAGGVTVRAIFTQDQHPVESGVRLVLTATGEGGRKVGPLQLSPSPEGRGFYISGPVLTPGSWDVAVTAPAPHAGTALVKVQAQVAQQMPEPTGERSAGATGAGRLGWLWWLGGAVLVVLVLGAIVQNRGARARR